MAPAEAMLSAFFIAKYKRLPEVKTIHVAAFYFVFMLFFIAIVFDVVFIAGLLQLFSFLPGFCSCFLFFAVILRLIFLFCGALAIFISV